jgi:putative two-component system response regulator
MMPHITGLDILKIRQRTATFKHIPFIILSANSENEIKREALQLGATDFLSKPVDPNDLALRVRNALTVKRHHDHLANYAVELEKQVRERTKQIEKSREQIIHCLARAAEYRDNETGEHVIRVGKYCAVIAAELGFERDYCHEIELAAQLHDVGKIGIPDSILLNPGKLSKEEFEVMKHHCGLGMQIMEPLAQSEGERIRKHTDMGGFIMDGVDSPMLELAASIARTHHEKWDGTGYPFQLKGENIPIEGVRTGRRNIDWMHSAANDLTSQSFQSRNVLRLCFRSVGLDLIRMCWMRSLNASAKLIRFGVIGMIR